MDINDKIHSHPRLSLPDENIWAYYSIMYVTPIVIEDFLIVMLSILLIDKSLKMNHYLVYNLPAFYSELKVQFFFILEGEHLAISEAGMYVKVPTADEINVCLANEGHLCVLNTALYPVEKIEWCVSAVFIKYHKLINTHFLVDSYTWHTNLAINLGRYIWAVSSLATRCIQIHC